MALRATQPAGSIPIVEGRSAGVQTGGVAGAGRAVVKAPSDEPLPIDVGTLIKHIKVTVPLLCVAKEDPGVLETMLNMLLQLSVR